MAEFVTSGFGARHGPWQPLSVPLGSAPPGLLSRAAVSVAPALPVEVRVGARPEDTAQIRRLEQDLASAQTEAETLRRELTAARASQSVPPVAQELEEEVARLRMAVEGVVASRQRVAQEVREGVGELVLATARRIAGEALRVQPGLLEALVSDAAATLGTEGLCIRVAPRDLDRITRALEASGVAVVADPDMEAGCVASSSRGAVDASLDTAVTALRAVVDQWQSAGWRDESGG